MKNNISYTGQICVGCGSAANVRTGEKWWKCPFCYFYNRVFHQDPIFVSPDAGPDHEEMFERIKEARV